MSAGIIPEGVPIRVDLIVADGSPLIIRGHVTTPTGVCPQCQQPSSRIHSHYWRSPQDLPWGAVPVRWHLACRKFWCDNPACPQTIFCERLPPGWLGVHQQRAQAVWACVTAWGWTASAADVARVATQQGLPVSADTVIRALRAAPDPPVGAVRVLGVDEWARRRGQTYATVLVDHEAQRIVDVLPDDAPETVATWLRAHPTVEVVTRDRDEAFHQAIQAGAPQARAVADRFHLCKNLSEALDRLFQRHPLPSPPSADAPTDPEPETEVRAAEVLTPGQQRREARWQTIHDRRAAGQAVSQIARDLGLDRQTVRAYAQRPAPPPRQARGRRAPPSLGPWANQLEELWDADVRTAAGLRDALQAAGFTGSLASCTRWLRARRGRQRRPAGERPPSRPISSRRWAMWCSQRWPQLRRHTTRVLSDRLQQDPIFRRAFTLTHQFHTLVTHRCARALPAWLAAAEASEIPELRRFAQGLRKDLPAVTAAATEPWSQGRTEGFNHRIKREKRLMYGRANFDLLRTRVLHRTP